MKTELFILGLLSIIIYCLYQLARNEKVYKIRINWINKNDPRLDKYTYEDMFRPSFKNWFGLKFPKESDF